MKTMKIDEKCEPFINIILGFIIFYLVCVIGYIWQKSKEETK